MSDEQLTNVLNARIKQLELELELSKKQAKIDLDETRRQLDNKIDELNEEQARNEKLVSDIQELTEKNTALNVKVVNLEESKEKFKVETEVLKQQLETLKSRKHYTSETFEYENDNQVFNAFLDNAEILKLNYSIQDMVNFYAATKSSKLTILEGISGTGKSKLITLYAKTIGLDIEAEGQEKRLKMIPVSPSWTDDADIMGFLDENKMEYKEASIGLVSFLKEAENHPDKPYLVCFDEMNLAKVEYYFAQFISILENELADRVLTIYNPKQEKNVKNAQDYPAQIRLGNNVIFCGTINVDESTYRLSDKVLDRACLIKLSAPKINDIDITVPEDAKIKVVKAKLADADIKPYLQDIEKKILNDLNEILTADYARFAIAYRVVNQIARFLSALPTVNGSLSREEALDRMIVQKILSKVRGTEEQIAALVGTINEHNNFAPGTICTCLNKYKDYSSFKEVNNAMEAKARELKRYGYVG